MSDPLLNVWEAAASSPFSPGIGKNTQFTVGFVLLAFCMSGASGARWSSMLTMRSPRLEHHLRPEYATHSLSPREHRLMHIQTAPSSPCQFSVFPLHWHSGTWPRSHRPCVLTTNSFGAVYMICAVGVYV
jgi:hypothetical protein